jgi:putative membrane protein
MAELDEQPCQEDPRVFFAAVRTVLAWVRTSLAMMGFGFVIARFGLFLRELSVVQPHAAHHGLGSAWIGAVMMILGSLACLTSAYSYARFLREHGRQRALVESMSAWPVRFAVVVGVLGLFLTVYVLMAT